MCSRRFRTSPAPRFRLFARAQNLIEVSVLIALVALVVIAILTVMGSGVGNSLSSAICGLTGGGSNCVTAQSSPTPSNGLSIALSPSSASPTVGQSQSFSAVEYGPNNSLLGDVTSTSTFTISPNGSCTANVCTATQAGNHTVTATANGASGHASLVFSHGSLSYLGLSPSNFSRSPGSTQAYTATGYDQYGNSTGDVTSATTFTISVGGSCSANLCSALTAGTYQVNGSAGGHTSSVPALLAVTPSTVASIVLSPTSSIVTSGTSQTYTATGFDQYGNSTGDVTSTTTFTIAPDGSCSLADCSATSAGAHAVTGISNGHSASALLTISAGAPISLRITPATLTIAAGSSQSYVATAYDAANNPTGVVTSQTTFTILPDGNCNAALCVAPLTGAHTITGNDSGITATATLNVNASTLDHLAIFPTSASIPELCHHSFRRLRQLAWRCHLFHRPLSLFWLLCRRLLFINPSWRHHRHRHLLLSLCHLHLDHYPRQHHQLCHFPFDGHRPRWSFPNLRHHRL